MAILAVLSYLKSIGQYLMGLLKRRTQIFSDFIDIQHELLRNSNIGHVTQ